MRAEVHEHGVVFHAEDGAEPVSVVCHLIVDGERLGRTHRSWGLERAAGQAAPGCGACGLHGYHHAPSQARPAGRLAAGSAYVRTMVSAGALSGCTVFSEAQPSGWAAR